MDGAHGGLRVAPVGCSGGYEIDSVLKRQSECVVLGSVWFCKKKKMFLLLIFEQVGGVRIPISTSILLYNVHIKSKLVRTIIR